MSIKFKCPQCGTQQTVEDSFAGKKLLCASCNQAIRVRGGSPGGGASPGPETPRDQGASDAGPAPSPPRVRSRADAIETPGAAGAKDWLGEGALADPSTPPLMRRERPKAAGKSPPLGLLLGLGAAGLAIVGLVVGLLVMRSRPRGG